MATRRGEAGERDQRSAMTERDEPNGSASPREAPMDQTQGHSSETPGKRLPEENQEPIILEVTDILDLHSFQPREIAEVVKTYLEEARAKGFSTVRIIHGKGTGTQREIVRSVLSKTSFVASFEDAPAEAGGWGAAIVWLSD
jgi:dsDNA-specific endonuclease/ATPase MutS2